MTTIADILFKPRYFMQKAPIMTNITFFDAFLININPLRFNNPIIFWNLYINTTTLNIPYTYNLVYLGIAVITTNKTTANNIKHIIANN